MFSPKKCGTGRVPGPANGKREKLSYVKICLCVLHLCVLGGHLGLLLLVQLGNTAVDADHGDQQHHETSSTTVMMRMTAEMGRVMKML